jgi:hypothetical protein
MAEEQAAHHLLNVLEERGLDVDLDKILLGFEDEATKHDAATWVEEYLHEDTLLTREELELWVLTYTLYGYRLILSKVPNAEEEEPASSVRKWGRTAASNPGSRDRRCN